MAERIIVSHPGGIARVEGEGEVRLRISGGRVEDVQLRIFEPPRLFEAFLRGRHCGELPDLTARICGICPVAYQLSACAAVEDACGVEVPAPVRDLRRLLYCGEWIESHALHVFFLQAPDALGYESAFSMAARHGDVVRGALQLKQAGNALLRAVGGREIHPVNVRVGGFYRAPSQAELAPVAEQLHAVRDFARRMIAWTAALPLPDIEEDFTFVALQEPDRYAIEGGRMTTTTALDLGPHAFDGHVVEEQVPHSTALHARLRGAGRYLTGPLARYALSGDRLSPAARGAARDAGLPAVVRNPFRAIVVRCAEILHAVDEALALIAAYDPPDPPAVAVAPRAATGAGWTEAPRGLLWHRYELAADGTIRDARIVPPTAQNLARIEDSVRARVEGCADLGDEALRDRCEQTVRTFDPCISCATHFLRLELDRR